MKSLLASKTCVDRGGIRPVTIPTEFFGGARGWARDEEEGRRPGEGRKTCPGRGLAGSVVVVSRRKKSRKRRRGGVRGESGSAAAVGGRAGRGLLHGIILLGGDRVARHRLG